MKPDNWNSMTGEAKAACARELVSTMRGQFIISQALVIAVRKMKKEKYPETSNIQDMEMLMEAIWPLYKFVAESQAQFEKLRKNGEV